MICENKLLELQLSVHKAFCPYFMSHWVVAINEFLDSMDALHTRYSSSIRETIVLEKKTYSYSSRRTPPPHRPLC